MGDAVSRAARARARSIERGRARGGEAVPRHARPRPRACSRTSSSGCGKAGEQHGAGQRRCSALRHLRLPRRPDRRSSPSERGFDDRQGRLRATSSTSARERSALPGSTRRRSPSVLKELAQRARRRREFLGYEGRGTTGEGTVQRDRSSTASASSSAGAGAQVELVFDQTPFYGETRRPDRRHRRGRAPSGAQVRIDDTKKPAGDMHVLHRRGRRPARSRSATR